MRRRMLLLPFLSAMWMGSCYRSCLFDERGVLESNSGGLSQHERDARSAVVAFALSLSILLVVAEMIHQERDQ